MMKIKIFLICILINSALFGQNGVPTFQSPNVEGLNKFIDFPVDKCTGVHSVDIPLYKIVEKDFSLPISISYHGGGIKVEEQASNVGLGWTLNCGGMISRSIKGNRADEFGYYANHGAPSYPTIIHNNCCDNTSFCRTFCYYGELAGDKDTEPDIFYFNFNGNAGKFVFDSSGKPNLIPEQDLKIEVGAFFGPPYYKFKITTPDGTQYFFGTANETRSFFVDGYASDQLPSAWNLDKIITKDKRQIDFEYDQEGDGAQRNLAHESALTKSGACPIVSYITNVSAVYSYRIKSITSANTRLDFKYKSSYRDDYSSYSIYKALDSIKIFNAITNELLKQFLFTTSYFQSTAPNLLPTGGAGGGAAQSCWQKRLRLDKVQELASNNDTLPAYRFSYNKYNFTTSDYLPTRLSMGQDHWGYYNGADSNTSLYPTLTVPGDPSTVLCTTSNNRNPNESYAKAFILDEIIHPTQGITIFKYECIKNNSNTIIGGGLRIKEITNIPDSTQLPITKLYEYSDPVIAGQSPKYTLYIDDGSDGLGEEHFDYPTCAYLNFSTSGTGWFMAFSDPIASHGELVSNTVFHGKVIERQIGNGSLESFFDTDDVNGEVTSNYDNDNCPLIAGTQSVQLLSGKLLKEVYKNEIGDSLKTIEYTYGTSSSGIQGNPYKVFKPFCYQRTKASAYGTGCAYLLSKTEFIHSNGYDLINKIEYEYTSIPSHHFPTKQIFYASDGDTIITRFKYPTDYASYGFITNLIGKNVIQSPIEKIISRKNATENVVDGEIKTYKNGDVSIDTIYKLEISEPQPFSGFTTSTMTSGGVFSKDSRYKAKMFFNAHDSIGNIWEYQKKDDFKSSYIWDYNLQYPIAEIKNADSSSVAFTSFEGDGKGNWTFTGSITDTASITGTKAYNLTSGDLSKSGLVSAMYIVSYWSKNGSYSVNSASPTKTGRTIQGWTYYEHEISGTSVTIAGSGCIDEVRLYPKAAQMSTYTYLPAIGMSSQCDINNHITYFFYDSFNRLRLIKDEDKNIIKKIEYKYNTTPQ